MKRILVLVAMLGMFLPFAVGCEKKPAEKPAAAPAEGAPATPAETPAEPAK